LCINHQELAEERLKPKGEETRALARRKLKQRGMVNA